MPFLSRFTFLLVSCLLLFPENSLCAYPSFSSSRENKLNFQEDTTKVAHYLDLSEKLISLTETRDSALYFLNLALDISNNWEDTPSLYHIYARFTDLYSKAGNYPVALDYSFKMLKILDRELKQAKDTLAIYRKYHTLYKDISYYIHFSDFEKGLFYLRKSLETALLLHESDPDFPIEESKIRIYNNIGSMYMEANQLDSAEFYHKEVLKYSEKLNDAYYNSIIYNNLGILNWELEQYEEADTYFKQSVAIKKELKDTAGLATGYLNLGKCNYIQGNYQLALEQFHTSLDYSRKTMNIRIETFALESLAETYLLTGAYQKANEYLKLFSLMKDSLSNTDKIRFGLATEMQYQFERRKQESDLKQQIVLANKERNVLIFILITCLLAFISVLLIFLYRHQRLKTTQTRIEKESLFLRNENLQLKNQQLAENLQTKDKELNLHAKYLLKKKESNNIALEQIAQIKNQEAEKLGIDLEEIKSNLEESVWNEFKILFQNLHHDFYVNLNNKHPNLTPNEKKLCTFIRLNMSTKEISAITFQQTKTIEIARSRLRGKLGLQRHENLTSYLQQF